MDRFARRLKAVGNVLAETVTEWIEDEGAARGAALSFYVILSLGPLLVLLVGVLQLVLSDESVRPAVIDTIVQVAGARAGDTAETVLGDAEPPDFLSLTSIFTVAALVFAATAVFANIQGALNKMWGVVPDAETYKQHVLGFLRVRLKGFAMIGFAGVLIGGSVLITGLTSLLAPWIEDYVPTGVPMIQALDFVVSVLVTGVLFGALFRMLPDVNIEWSTVWVGAFGTAILFVAGKIVIAHVIGQLSWTSYYGPGTSVVVFLAWVYFSAQIFFLGAEFTQVWSRRRGGILGGKANVPSSSDA